MKKIVKCIIFILIFCIIWNHVFHILWLNETSITAFYQEPKNSLDVVYIGSSNAHDHFNTTLAYHLHGFTTGMLSNDTQIFPITKYLLKEARKTQNPKLYVLDMAKYPEDDTTLTEARIRKATDSLKFSKNRIDAINEIFQYADVLKNDVKTKSGNNIINYYFSYLMYHNRWKNIQEINYMGDSTLYKGFTLNSTTIRKVPFSEYKWIDKKEKLPQYNEKVFLDLIDYIKKNDLNVLFVISQRAYIPVLNGRLNTMVSILEKNDLKVLNFNTLNDFSLNYKTDMFDKFHNNIYGSTKYTLYFSKYLKENYHLKDHRKDKNYQSWNEEYQKFKSDFENLTKKNFDNILENYKKSYD